MFLLQGVYIPADWLTINDFGPSRFRSTSFAIFMQCTKKASSPRAASLRIRVRSSMLTRFLREDSRGRATYTISNRKSDEFWGIKEELRTGEIEQGNLAVRRLGAAFTTPVDKASIVSAHSKHRKNDKRFIISSSVRKSSMTSTFLHSLAIASTSAVPLPKLQFTLRTSGQLLKTL